MIDRTARRLLLAALATAALSVGCDGDSDGEIVTLPDGADAGAANCPSVAPSVTITYPADEAPHTAGFLEITGSSTGAGEVEITVDDGGPLVAAGLMSWSTTVQLTEGPHTIRAVPKGRRGCADGSAVTHTVVQGSEMTLVAAPPLGEVELRLDRHAIGRLLTPEDQESIVLAYLDLGPLVQNALAALEDPEAWGIDTSDWQAEKNLAALLVMSPDSADLSGTALAPVMDLSGQLGLPPPRILSEMLALAPSERFLGSEIVTEVMLDLLIRSHPNFPAHPDGLLAVTLGDGLADLAPLYDKYGPSGEHPGFLAEPPEAELFTPAFAMIVRGTGNVVVQPGFRPGEGFASHVVAPPAGEAILQLDFEDPETFRIVGLHPQPRAALTLEVPESDQYFEVPAPPADGSTPEAPGLNSVWDAPQWTLEHIVAEASRRAFGPRWPDGYSNGYALGAIDPAASLSWVDGWVVVDVVADLGPPPAPAYIWDLILDVAQQRLHDGGIAEGDANVRLALPLLPIGLDAEALIDTMRPALEAQKAALVALMVGDAAALPSRATVWLDGDRLVVDPAASPLFPSRQALAENVDPTREVALDDTARTYWTLSADNRLVALNVGPWRGDRVTLGETVMEGP